MIPVRYFLSYRYCTQSLICLHRGGVIWWFRVWDVWSSKVTQWPAVVWALSISALRSIENKQQQTTAVQQLFWKNGDMIIMMDFLDLIYLSFQETKVILRHKVKSVLKFIVWWYDRWPHDTYQGCRWHPLEICAVHIDFSALLSKVILRISKNTTLT